MPYKLCSPGEVADSPYWYVRGTEFGIYCKRSTQTSDKREAQGFLKRWRDEAKRLSVSGPKREAVTFASAAISYMQSGRSKLFLAPLIEHFGDTPLDQIDQAAIDQAASILGSKRAPQTNNRLVYTPTIAILRHSGTGTRIRRPKAGPGGHRIEWLKPEEAFRLLDQAASVDGRLGALLTFLLYTGVRLSEALRLEWKDVDLSQSTATIGRTKNGSPITVYLNSEVVAQLGNLDIRKARVFGLAKSGRLYNLLARTEGRSGVSLPPNSAFHILRHTHAMWRRLYTRADTSALMATGLWKSAAAARVYEHIDVTEEARKADLLPTPKRAGK
jgi:integrase